MRSGAKLSIFFSLLAASGLVLAQSTPNQSPAPTAPANTVVAQAPAAGGAASGAAPAAAGTAAGANLGVSIAAVAAVTAAAAAASSTSSTTQH